MANYVESNLGKNEEIIVKAKISWLTMIPAAVAFLVWAAIGIAVKVLMGKLVSEGGAPDDKLGMVGTIIMLVCFFFGLIPVIKRALINNTTHLAVTNKRIIGKTGVLKVESIDYPIDKIDNVSYRANFWGNLLHYYALEIKGGGDQARKIAGIANALEFKNKVTDAIELHAEEARKAQAAEIAMAMSSAKNA